jgi:hypothetical protein
MDKDSKTHYVGLGVCDVLFIIFLVLKLVGVINWSWWWVTAPLWIPLALVILSIPFMIIFWKRIYKEDEEDYWR